MYPLFCYDGSAFRAPFHISEREGPVLPKPCAAQVGRMFLLLLPLLRASTGKSHVTIATTYLIVDESL